MGHALVAGCIAGLLIHAQGAPQWAASSVAVVIFYLALICNRIDR